MSSNLSFLEKPCCEISTESSLVSNARCTIRGKITELFAVVTSLVWRCYKRYSSLKAHGQRLRHVYHSSDEHPTQRQELLCRRSKVLKHCQRNSVSRTLNMSHFGYKPICVSVTHHRRHIYLSPYNKVNKQTKYNKSNMVRNHGNGLPEKPTAHQAGRPFVIIVKHDNGEEDRQKKYKKPSCR